MKHRQAVGLAMLLAPFIGLLIFTATKDWRSVIVALGIGGYFGFSVHLMKP